MVASSWMLQKNQLKVADAYIVDCYAPGGSYGTGWVNTPTCTSGVFRYVGSSHIPYSAEAAINVQGNVLVNSSTGIIQMDAGVISLHNYFEFTGTGAEFLGNYFLVQEWTADDEVNGETYVSCPLVNPNTYWGGGAALFTPKPNTAYLQLGYAFSAYGGTIPADTAKFGFTFQMIRYE